MTWNSKGSYTSKILKPSPSSHHIVVLFSFFLFGNWWHIPKECGLHKSEFRLRSSCGFWLSNHTSLGKAELMCTDVQCCQSITQREFVGFPDLREMRKIRQLWRVCQLPDLRKLDWMLVSDILQSTKWLVELFF